MVDGAYIEGPVPNWIPDEMLSEHQEEARRLISGNGRRRPGVLVRLCSPDVWWVAIAVFAVLTIGGVFVGLIVYAAIAEPWIFLLVVGPTVFLFGLSLLIAVKAGSRWLSPPDQPAG